MNQPLRVLELHGSYYDLGYQHGKAHHDEIHMFTEERLHLSSDIGWTGHSLSRDEVLSLGAACLAEHERYTPHLMDELRGTADATGLSLAELVIMNGFTDFVDVVYNQGDHVPTTHGADNCTAFLVPNSATADGRGMFGQTWDMHHTATPYVMLYRGQPDNGDPAFLTFTITGCVGMIGMNDAGIAVGINNLRGGDGQIGVTWTFVVREILRQRTLDDALRCLTDVKLAGAHNYLLMDKHGNGYNVEAMSTYQHVQPLQADPIAHTNHCLIPQGHAVERDRPPESLASSESRLQRANDLTAKRPITLQDLMALTADDTVACTNPIDPFYVETCGAAVMRPSTGDFWAIWGTPSVDGYEHFTI